MSDVHIHLCGGNGRLTPEAKRELERFAQHLRCKQEKRPCDVADCPADACRVARSLAATLPSRENSDG